MGMFTFIFLLIAVFILRKPLAKACSHLDKQVATNSVVSATELNEKLKEVEEYLSQNQLINVDKLFKLTHK